METISANTKPHWDLKKTPIPVFYRRQPRTLGLAKKRGLVDEEKNESREPGPLEQSR